MEQVGDDFSDIQLGVAAGTGDRAPPDACGVPLFRSALERNWRGALRVPANDRSQAEMNADRNPLRAYARISFAMIPGYVGQAEIAACIEEGQLFYNGFRQSRPLNRAKSESVEQRVARFVIAWAARTASERTRPTEWDSVMSRITFEK